MRKDAVESKKILNSSYVIKAWSSFICAHCTICSLGTVFTSSKVHYLIFQTDFVRKLIAQFPGCRCRVGQQGFGVSVHECDGQHQGLFGLGSLKFQPTGWLIPGAVVESSLQPLLAVGGVTGRSLSNQRLVSSPTEFYSVSYS